MGMGWRRARPSCGPARARLRGRRALLGAAAAEGLFQRAIVQRGGCSQQSLESLVSGMSEPFITNSGCAGSEDIPACLRELDVATVLLTAPDGYPDVAGLSRRVPMSIASSCR